VLSSEGEHAGSQSAGSAAEARRWLPPWPVLALLAVVYAIITLGEVVRWGGTYGVSWWADSGWTLASLLALVSGLATARRVQGRDGVVWLLFAAGCGAWLLGQLAYDYYELVERAFPPTPSLSDAGLLAFAPLCVAGLALIGRAGRSAALLLALDIAVLGLALGVLFTLVFHDALRHTALTGLGSMTVLLYSALYSTLSGTLFFLPLRYAWRNPSLRLLLLGFLAEVIPFVAWTPLLLSGAYTEGTILDLLWMAGMLLIAAAALSFRRFPSVAAETQVAGVFAVLPLVLTVIVAAAVPAHLGGDVPIQQARNYVALLLVLVVLVVVRQGLTLRSNGALLRDARRQLAFTHAITANLGEGVVTLDTAGRVTSFNQAAEGLLGWPEAEARGAVLHNLIHVQRATGTDICEAACPLRAVLRAGQAGHREDVFTRKDGTLGPVAWTASPILTDGQVRGTVIAFQDITARKQAQRALHSENRRLQQIVTNAPVAMAMVDTEMRYLAYSGPGLVNYLRREERKTDSI